MPFRITIQTTPRVNITLGLSLVDDGQKFSEFEYRYYDVPLEGALQSQQLAKTLVIDEAVKLGITFREEAGQYVLEPANREEVIVVEALCTKLTTQLTIMGIEYAKLKGVDTARAEKILAGK